jgi:short-subunit dehydrogenase
VNERGRNGGGRGVELAHVLITGAAGAIGGSLARRMRAVWPSARLALLDRDAGAMTALAGELGNATTHGIDLRAVDRLPAEVAAIEEAADLPIDGLVNCAGIMRVRRLCPATDGSDPAFASQTSVGSWSWDEANDLVTIDLLAPLRLQDLLARRMVERGSGAIINVASMAGKVPLKGCTYYGASKAGLAMASEIARAELAPHGVRVVTVYPGPVKSGLEQGAREEYGASGWFARMVPTGDPDELAHRIVRAVERDEARVIYPRLYGVGWSANNLSRRIALSYGPPPVA